MSDLRTFLRRHIKPLLRPLWQVGLRYLAPKPDKKAPPLAPPYIVVGLFRAASGLGESARLCYQALDELGKTPLAVDVSDLFGQMEIPLPDNIRLLQEWPEGGSLIIHLNAPEMAKVCLALGHQAMHGKRIIGYWAWELPDIPSFWKPGFSFVHEIWACSQFTAAAFHPHTKKPVKVVHHRVVPFKGVPQPVDDLRLPSDAFIVLAMANADSSLARKNPFAAITAFRHAFGDDPRALLLLHIGRLRTHPAAEAALREACGGAKNILLYSKPLNAAQRAWLMGRVDTVISLHRAEGFGLVMAEAMLAGKPVIATAWSGNIDFMDDESSILIPAALVPVEDPFHIYGLKGAVWADADTAKAATALRGLFDLRQNGESPGQRAAVALPQKLSLAHYAKQAEIP